MRFEGIYTPTVTPFTPEGLINKDAFAEVLESLIEAKVHGIIIGGSTGEYYAHTAQERFDLAAQAKDVIGSRLALVVGTAATRTERPRPSARTRSWSRRPPTRCRPTARTPFTR